MRWKLPAGVLMALAVLIPAAPAMAEAGTPGLNAKCQTVERSVYKDLRKFITIDLDTATDVQVRILAGQILQLGMDESLSGLPQAVQKQLDGTPEELRAFLKGPVRTAWAVALEISVTRTLVDAGPNVRAAAQKVLDEGTTDDHTIDDELAFLNDGVYAARALDCASHPTHSSSATPSVTPSASGTGAAVPTASASGSGSGGAGGGLPVTGADTGTVVAIGGALLLLGGAGFLITRRRRSRFVA